ncbi:hypothetical protein [Sphaerisporangium corydalis]|uniref:Uncharacterized protein n=1 Tax=Sphaerisporangium corydalis TaxID=1441875 RepID=A0ABV9E925_9ACTN|nr:hypothetical protein [Sphaerisporangium corydalis]
MDPLVLAAGTALVTAMATDGWEQARAGAVALWRRVHPERVPAIEAELVEVRDELLAARRAGDVPAEEGLVSDWQRRLRRLLADDPGLAAELRRVLDEQWAPLLPAGRSPEQVVVQSATVSGSARVYQAGRDQYNSGS